MHDDHDTDHSQTDLTTNPKDNTNNGDIDIETDILQLTGEELESTYRITATSGRFTRTSRSPLVRNRLFQQGTCFRPRSLETSNSTRGATKQRLSRCSTVVTTCVAAAGTSSGKTLVYGLHIARQYLEDPETRGPLSCIRRRRSVVTRSKELNEFLRNTLGLEISVGVYDGDTKSERKVSHPR